MLIDILEATGGIIGILAIIIVIWDHFKDDRRLTKQVQEFYNDIEKLILSIYKKTNQPNPNMVLIETLKFVGEPDYQKAKVKQSFDEFSKYLGLTKIEYKDHRTHNVVDAYINREGFILVEDGWLKEKVFQAEDRFIIGSFTFQESVITEIKGYLEILRNYWGKNYSKLFFRPKLDIGLKIFKL